MSHYYGWEGESPALHSGSISLLSMTEEQAKKVEKRKKKHPFGFSDKPKKKPKK